MSLHAEVVSIVHKFYAALPTPWACISRYATQMGGGRKSMILLPSLSPLAKAESPFLPFQTPYLALQLSKWSGAPSLPPSLPSFPIQFSSGSSSSLQFPCPRAILQRESGSVRSIASDFVQKEVIIHVLSWQITLFLRPTYLFAQQSMY